jgi:hypothetical protein
MSALEQALGDYLQLRRSLGHQLAEAAWLLPGFGVYLDGQEAQTVTIEAALVFLALARLAETAERLPGQISSQVSCCLHR